MSASHPGPLAPPPIDPSATPSPRRPASTSSHAVQTLQKVALAGTANMAAAFFTNPADLVKVRQQLLVKTAAPATTSTAWYAIMWSMIKQEGPTSIYKGLSASIFREATYSGIRMGLYDSCKELIRPVLGSAAGKKDDGLAMKLGAGMVSGAIGAGIANPADLIKVRMQSVGASGTLRSHAFKIYETGGFKGFYRAIVPTTIRAAILTSSQLGSYDHAKTTLMADFPEYFQEGFKTHLAASGIAGFVCSAASAPVDVIKVRLMSDSKAYTSSLQCLVSIFRNEGPTAFYKGFSMCWLRLWPHSVISLLIFEKLRSATGLNPI